MTIITAMTIGTNYPENILIDSAKDNDKFLAAMYLMRDGHIHRILVSTNPVFDSKEEAEKVLHDVAKELQAKYNPESISDATEPTT